MPYIYEDKQRQVFRFQYTDWAGKRRTGTGFGYKKPSQRKNAERETKKFAYKIEREHEEIRKGYRPPPQPWQKHLKRPFEDVKNEYLEWGEARGGKGGRPWSKSHVRNRRSFLAWWQKWLKVKTMADLDGISSKVEKGLTALRKDGYSEMTVKAYLEALRSFINWCLKHDMLMGNPIRNIGSMDATPSKHRRAFSAKEIHALMSVAPEHRQLVYETALCSGLRAKELRSLRTDDLLVGGCGLRLHAEWTKNRKPGLQPLPAWLVERLRMSATRGDARSRYRKSRGAWKPLPEGVPENPLLFVTTHPDRYIRKDMEAAGIPKERPEGVADFHSLRVTYVTMAEQAGAGVKELQELARHSTPALTMKSYARAWRGRLVELSEAVGKQVRDAEADDTNTKSAEQEKPGAATG